MGTSDCQNGTYIFPELCEHYLIEHNLWSAELDLLLEEIYEEPISLYEEIELPEVVTEPAISIYDEFNVYSEAPYIPIDQVMLSISIAEEIEKSLQEYLKFLYIQEVYAEHPRERKNFSLSIGKIRNSIKNITKALNEVKID